MNDKRTDLLIIGAGPFGLALAACARDLGIQHVLVGKPMGFWAANMPCGMLLRSTCDWSLDPLGIHSIDAFLETRGESCGDIEPLSRDFYLDYTDWFRAQKGLECLDTTVESLGRDGSGFAAVTQTGEVIRARIVVLALGFRHFANVPPELARMVPRGRFDHTCDLVDFRPLRGKRVLVIGGRQSAFEWAALLREEGASRVDLSYRHETPAFAPSDWSWVTPMVERLVREPGWYACLDSTQKQRIGDRLWAEGRLKLEPWLAYRIGREGIYLHPVTELSGVNREGTDLRVTLDDGTGLTVDHIVLATGYKVDMARVPMLADTILPELDLDDGFPVLDDGFQTNVQGLYVTSLAATRHFGPFLGFTVAARAQAQIISGAIAAQLAER